MKRPAGQLGDVWSRLDETDDPQFYVRFLDASRARALELARKDPQAFFAHLAPSREQRVLDAGCGTGDLLALLAPLVGSAVGLDFSRTMVDEARRRHPQGVKYEQGDVQSLPFPDAAFDRVLATQLLIHVPDPVKALAELVRVTAPGGQLFIGDVDWDTLVLACDDRALGRAFTHGFCDGIRNGLFVRELPARLRAAGLRDVTVTPQQMIFESFEFANPWIVEPALRHLRDLGQLPPADLDRFAAELEERGRTGRFWASMTFYTVRATR